MRKAPPSNLARTRPLAQAAALALAPLLALAACAPDLGPKPEPAPIQDYATTRSFKAPDAAWPNSDWWRAYGDPQLDALIAEALTGSPDMRIAQARLLQADAVARQAGASLFPTLTANASAGAERSSLNEGFPDSFRAFLPHGWQSQGRVTADLNYELDLFGKNRAEFAAATSEVEAAEVDFAQARLTLSTAIASAYANLVRLNADRVAAQDAVRVRQQSADLVSARVSQGLENTGEAAQARSRVGSAQADADRIDGAIALARNELAALLGKGPDRGLAIVLPTNARVSNFGVPPKLSADLIGRRPDIVASRLRAEAASHRIDAAHADFYPNIDLTAFIGLESIGLSRLVSPASQIGQIGPAIHLPIFDGGRIEGAYRGARAEYDEAVATYDKTLTGALRDVADALANQRELANELGHASAALAASEDAYRVAKQRYGAGLSRYLDVLTAEDTLVQQRRAVADLKAQAFTQDVALVRALGGGFVSSV